MSKTKKIQPLFDYILVEPAEQEDVTASGIVLPDNAKEKPQSAVVKAVGEDVKQVKVGDIVIHKKWGGNDVKVDGKDMMLIKEEDIMAKEV